MKYAIVAAAMALSASAIPTTTAPPAKFAIQITAKMNGQDKTLFLGKDGKGTGVPDIKSAAVCSITGPENNLICEGKTMGAKPAPVVNYVDMAAIAAVDGSNALTDGFSVDENMVLQWRSKKFAGLPQVGQTIMEKQGGKANWGIFKSNMLTSGELKLYAQLGCPMDAEGHATHSGPIQHDPLYIGSNKVVPV